MSRRHASQLSGASGSSATPRRYTSTGGRTRSADVIAYDSATAASSRGIVTRDTVHRATVARFTCRNVPGDRSGKLRSTSSVSRRAARSRPAAVPARPAGAESNASCTTVTVALPRPAQLTRPRRWTIESSVTRSITA